MRRRDALLHAASLIVLAIALLATLLAAMFGTR